MRFHLLVLLTLAALMPVRAALTYELLAEFEDPGSVPLGPLTYVAEDGAYYGTTAEGGVYGYGTVFKVTPGGVRTVLVSFSGKTGATKGARPESGLVAGADGKLYGTTTEGGADGFGTIFRVGRDGTGFATLVEFTGETGLAKGAVPNGLLLHSDGNFYGTTQAGGSQRNGTVFRLSSLGIFTTMAELTGRSGSREGTMPVGTLVGSGTVLYGVTAMGGQPDHGVIFSISTTPDMTWTLMRRFTGKSGAARGSLPGGGLVLHPDGALYGTTSEGGTNEMGTVFKITTAANPVFTTLWDFNETDGAEPVGALTVGGDLALYGTTAAGGAEDEGCVFRVTTSVPVAQSVLVSFTGDEGVVRGEQPAAGLTVGPGGVFAGTTSAGGAGNTGTVFEVTASGVFKHVADFTNAEGWGVAGAPLAMPGGGVFAPLHDGGTAGGGTLWSLGAANPALVFGDPLGVRPAGGLVAVDGALYGVTARGGASDRGTIFRHTPGGSTETVSEFSAASGSSPEGPLTPGPGGIFYGVARDEGPGGFGTIFCLWPDGTRTTLAAFTGTGGLAPGARPRAPLARDAMGNIYGVTELGGAHNCGTVFKLAANGTLSTLAEFTATGPGIPRGGLVAAPDGSFYGTTMRGGAALAGTVFKVTPAGTVATVAEFTGGSSGSARGAAPMGALLAAIDGTLYGTTAAAGANGYGTIFKVSPAGSISTLRDFTGAGGSTPGESPRGGLQFGPDGKIYGHTEWGGPRGGGTVFRLAGFGPHIVTDPPTFLPGKAIVRSRVQSGGVPVTTWFRHGTQPTLMLSATPDVALSNTSAIHSHSHTFTGIPASAAIFYRAECSDGSATVTGDTLDFLMPSPLIAWSLGHLSTATPNLLDDPDSDKSENLTEYGLVTDPNTPNAPAPAPFLKNYPDGRRLAIILRRDPARTDVTITVQAAPSLSGPWTDLAVSSLGQPFTGVGYVTGETPGTDIREVEIRDIVSVSNAPQRIIRVRVSN